MDVYLVSCVSQKRATPSPAKDLYTSPLFRKARAYVERTGGPWFVLSAKYGLVHPDEVIEPYDLTLNTMGVADRRRWAGMVLTQLEPHLDGVGSRHIYGGPALPRVPGAIFAGSSPSYLNPHGGLENR